MKTVTVINQTRGSVFLDSVEVADNFYSRLKGLLGRPGLPASTGLMLKPANSIHTIGMKFAIDAAFIDRNGIILRIIEKMPAGQISPVVFGSACVIETAAGEFEKYGATVSDRLTFQPKTG